MIWRALLLCLFTLVMSHALRAAPGPTVILISIDGMRWDYLEQHQPPQLQALAREGVRLAQMIPTFPSKTYPNHYTLVTGLRVERHGIVGNEMFDPASGRFFRLADRAAVNDPRWWGGEPIWVTASRQGRRTAAMFWPGTEVAIHGVRPAYWFPYDHHKPHAERVEQVLAWLDLPAEQRPSFITLYFAAVDDAGHEFGPLAAETRAALHEVDAQIGALRRGLSERRIDGKTTLVVVSDHGMADVARDRVVYLDDVLPEDQIRYDMLGPIAGLRPPDEDVDRVMAQLRRLPHVRVLRKRDLPASAGYTHHGRIPDVLVIADEGWEVSTRAADANREWASSRGNHGFDPAYGSMAASFIASGPRFPRGEVWPAAENIHVYNLLCALLEVQPASNDGDDRLVKRLRPVGAR